MNDQIETANEALSTEYSIQLGQTASIAVLTLATYGAADLTRRIAIKTKQILSDRKAKKAAQKIEDEPHRSQQ